MPRLDFLTEEVISSTSLITSSTKQSLSLEDRFWTKYETASNLLLYTVLNQHDLPSVHLPYPFNKWHDSLLVCRCANAYALRTILNMNENKDNLERELLFTPETVRVQVSEIIRMRSSARKAYGLIQDMSLEDRTRRIVEVHACITKMKAFLQEMIIAEGEVLEGLDEEARDTQRKLDRTYKSNRGLAPSEIKEKKEKTIKKANDYSSLLEASGLSMAEMLAKLNAK